ncbi:MAG: alpha/beta fold hydrolase BchO [Pseudomonadota bacterium]
MDWARHRADWPYSATSRFVRSRPHTWHIQKVGDGPQILLLHGAGASTHSWRGVMAILAERFAVTALDLPGHGFTKLGTSFRSGLPSMTSDLESLFDQENLKPDLIVGHSAGGAVALELARRGHGRGVVTVNAALDRFEGVAGWLFPLMARFLAINPLVPSIFARLSGGPEGVRRILGSTGSRVDDEMVRFYAALASDRAHVSGTLSMMSQWSVDALARAAPEITAPCLFIIGDRDGTVPPAVSERFCERMPGARMEHIAGLGHLLHEEAPDLAARLITTFWDETIQED